MIRMSTESDRDSVQQLMHLCFGDRDAKLPDNLDDRFYLYFKGDVLVAMTGLTSDSQYKHLEVDWTCTHPEYRHCGYMQKLFEEMLRDVTTPVVCSCWRLSGSDKVNLHTLMDMFDFEEVVRARVHWKVPYNCFRNSKSDCVCYSGKYCECYEDLYLRKCKQCSV